MQLCRVLYRVGQKKLVPGCEKGSAQSGHAGLVLDKTVTFLRPMLYLMYYWARKAAGSLHSS